MSNYGLVQWSQTASANSSADVNVFIPESPPSGMAPSAVNDQFRSIMQSMAKWRDDENGTLVTGGSTTAASFNSNQNFAALNSGLTVTFGLAGTLDSCATLNVDGLGAVGIYMASTTKLGAGQLLGGTFNRATYLSSTPAWMVHFVVTNPTSSLMTLTGTHQVFSGGAKTPAVAVTSSTAITIDCGLGPLQYTNCSHAMVITAPANDGFCSFVTKNTSSAGTITTSGFTVGSFTGDAVTTSSGNSYIWNIIRINGTATYTVKARQ